MDNGSIIERGTHWELLAANGTYAHMWELQQQEEQTRQLLDGPKAHADAIASPG
jgi:ATP-binding cassette subfamily B protein